MTARLPESAQHRARRWDVLVLGSALPGLVAAVRLAMGGLRVLVAEEETAAQTSDLLRDPFFLPASSVLDASLRALGIPLIDRRSLEAQELAYQVLLPEARVDIGGAAETAEELVAWGLAKPDPATALLRALSKAGDEGALALLQEPALRRGELRFAAPPSAIDLGVTEGPLSHLIGAQVAGLTGVTRERAGPASTRSLSAALSGGAIFAAGRNTLRGLLKQRIRSLHGEVRTLGCPFHLVELGSAPGIARVGPGDAWLGRALVLNAPSGQIAAAQRTWGHEVPPALVGATPDQRRVAVHLRGLREAIPEPLAPRALWWPDELRSEGRPPIQLALHPSSQGQRFVEMVLATWVPVDDDRDDEAWAASLLEATAEIVPLETAQAKMARPTPRPLWDLEALAMPASDAWPESVSIRASSRRPVFRLPRDEISPLGVEGDFVLGWRAGDAIRGELA